MKGIDLADLLRRLSQPRPHHDDRRRFLALKGSGEVEVRRRAEAARRRPHSPGGPSAKRKVWVGPEGIGAGSVGGGAGLVSSVVRGRLAASLTALPVTRGCLRAAGN